MATTGILGGLKVALKGRETMERGRNWLDLARVYYALRKQGEQMFGRLLATLRGEQHASATEAVAAQRRRFGMELSATLYCYAGRTYLVTSVMTAPFELMVETGTPSVLPVATTDAAIGEAALWHLAQMVKRRPPTQRDRKLTDWTVYQASGAKSVRAFTSASVAVAVETTSTGIALSARGAHVVEGEPWATATAPLDPAALGAAIRRVIADAEASVG